MEAHRGIHMKASHMWVLLLSSLFLKNLCFYHVLLALDTDLAQMGASSEVNVAFWSEMLFNK